MTNNRQHTIIIALLCLFVLLVFSACGKVKEAEKTADPLPQLPAAGSAETLPIELFDWINRPFADFKTLYGEPEQTVNSEMTGLPLAQYADLEVNLSVKNALLVISGFSLLAEKQTDPAKYSIKGVTFAFSNRQVLDKLGLPVNGGRSYLCYSEDYALWWKYDFGADDQLQRMGLFYGADQKDRTFVEWRK
ncbi:MAG: hypothetical protein LLG09_05940 [Negativicutes bacterium]|nr:hypothetical protein [Negativicutes bacterium]